MKMFPRAVQNKNENNQINKIKLKFSNVPIPLNIIMNLSPERYENIKLPHMRFTLGIEQKLRIYNIVKLALCILSLAMKIKSSIF